MRSVTQASHAESSPAVMSPATIEATSGLSVAVHTLYVDHAEPTTPGDGEEHAEGFQAEQVPAEPVLSEALEDERELLSVSGPPDEFIRT